MKLGIGTVQFGMKYGLTNQTERTSIHEAKKMIEMAGTHGIKVIDTAKAYGDSEEVLGKIFSPGNQFNIVTKLPILMNEPHVSKTIKKLFLDSLTKLKQVSIYGLLLHHSEDLFSPLGSEIYRVLLNLKEEGFVKKIGISVYNKHEIEKVLEKYEIDLVQLPLNIFDQRFIQSRYLKTLQHSGIEIHARSIFLQGLILTNPNTLPSFFDPIKNSLIAFHEEMKRNNMSKVEAALKFVSDLKEVDHVIVGVNNPVQLQEILQCFNNKMIPYDFTKFAINKEKYVNPANWNLN